MVKLSGGSRTLSGGSREYSRREVEFNQLMHSGQYSSGYFSQKGGGYYVVERSSANHKPEEIEAARFMADRGYCVALTNEAGQGDRVKSPDGKIFTASFEQRTPTGDSSQNFNKCLEHAKIKGADMAVVFMKNAGHTKSSVEAGIRKYEAHNSYRFQQIIVVTKDGRIHKHRHNK